MTAIQDLVQTAFVHASSLRSMLTADTQSTARTVQSLTADLQRANEQIEEHKSTINLLEEENRALETRGTELAGRSKEHRSRARELERRTRELDGWGSQLEERCQERDKHINDLVALVQSLEADHAALLCERDAFAAEASRVNREMLAERETHDRDMKARQAEWETHSKALDAEAARLRTELAAAQSQIDMLKRNMDTLRETSDRDSRARVAEVDKRRLQAETRLAKVQSDHTATVKDMERMRAEMHELRQAHNQEIKARIADMDSRYKQVEASAAKLRTEHAAAMQEIARLLKEVAVLQDHKCVVPHHPQPHAQHQQHQQQQHQQQQNIMPNLAKSQKEGILKRQGAADASRMHDMSVASVSFASTTASFSAMDVSRLRGPRPPLPRVPEKVPAQPASGSTSGSTDAVSTASSSRPAPKLAAKASSTSLYLSASNNHGQQHGASDGTYSTTTLPIGSMSALGPALAAGDSSQLFELPSMMSEVSMNQSSLLDRSELIFRHSRQSLIINYRDLPLADIETVLDSVKRRAIILQRRRPIWSVRPMSGSGMAGKNPKLRRSALLSLAALVIQTHWRGYKARRLLSGTCTRFFVAAELIETEASYLQGLFTIITCALPVKDVLQAEPDSHGMLTRPDFNRILLSIEKVANTSATLLFLLAGRLQYWHVDQTIGDLFGLMAPHLKVYSVYVDRYADTLKYFSLPKAVMKMYTQDALHLHDLLITPIQRLSMYKLLVEVCTCMCSCDFFPALDGYGRAC
ncbi:hypothetical protein BC831DRAFT_444948 [Entophlyctis helioformis]|nr:hypothetical protein BC831DRAFT_444948 [Entophlyctis helioformis]